MSHEVFSIVVPVDRAKMCDLERFLDPTGDASTPIPGLPLDGIPAVHFASFVVFPGTPVVERPGWLGRRLGMAPRTLTPRPLLVFESCVDGPVDDYLDALVHVGAHALQRVFSHCLEPAPADRDGLREYLVRHIRRPQLWHAGNPGLRTDHVKAAATLRKVLDEQLDGIVRRRRSADPPLDLLARLRAKLNVPRSRRSHWHFSVRQVPDAGGYSWFADPVSRWASRMWHWLRVAPVFLLGLAGLVGLGWLWATRGTLAAGLVVIAVVGAVWLAGAWLKGRHPPPVERADHLQRLKELEDVGVQNHMASLVLLKNGWLRRLSIRAVLTSFNLFYRTFFTDITPGRILGLGTIHFAQWTIVPLVVDDDRGRMTRREGLMFLSNYDGSWDTYLDDFVTFLLRGVIAIWSNAVGFPWPLDPATFKAWARTCMSPWHYWYRRYPDLTVLNIEGNDSIRQGLLSRALTPDDARLWLSRFGSLKAGHEDLADARGALETDDIQGLVLSGYQHLPEAAYVLLHIERPAEVRQWIGELSIAVGDAAPRARSELAAEKVRFNLAFTWLGLDALGLPPAVLERFPLVFREGMAPKDLQHRSRALGDTGESAPAHWAWGAPHQPAVHVLVMVFATDQDALAAALDRQVSPLVASGAAIHLGCLSSRLNIPAKGELPREPFGFADGISQPVLEGSRAAARAAVEASQHLLKPGEFVLGYVAGNGAVAPGVPLEPGLDPLDWLPGDVTTGGRLHDLGRNGSYLVVRQLEQDAKAFEREMSQAAPPEALAARVVGRWRDGTPLVTGPATGPRSNDFTYAGDPHGFDCPIGAHVRRANPRDSLLPDPAAALALANRHRLLRRGRPYRRFDPQGLPAVAGDDTPDRGMVFLCLNGDIERQFEFVQQNWVVNPSFGGLYDEQDPLLGDGGRLSVQRDPLRQRRHFSTDSRFVTVRGGGYFFLPGLSALSYLAHLESPAAEPMTAPALAPQASREPVRLTRPSWMRRALALVEGLLPGLRLTWAVRFPLAVAAVLVLLAWAPSLAPALGTNLFLTDKVGLALLTALASLTAFVVMVTLRLVLLYGWRVGLGRARWQSRARWLHVLSFQVLALPLTLTSLHRCAYDAAGAAWNRDYLNALLDLAPAALAGFGAAFVLVGLASGVQSLQPAARPDLFVPPNPLLTMLGSAAWRPRILRAVSRRLTKLAAWSVDVVPEELGQGYIDYRHRRILPGHVFAGVLAVIVLCVYLLGYVALNPAWSGLAGRVPPVAYIIVVLMLAGWWLSAAAFFLDRYRVPTLVVMAGWLALIASAAHTDHFFAVGDQVTHEPLSPPQIVKQAWQVHPDRGLIVVTSEGLGLVSAAWTAEVLTRLAEALGPRFTESLRLASVSSGAALGAASFVHEFGPGGFPPGGAVGERVRRRARTPGSSEGAWGLVYPDLVRTIAPAAVPRRADRGWAMEQAWRRAFDGADPTVGDWRQGVGQGWRPATAFGVTVVESGERAVLATYDSPVSSTDVTGGRDLAVLTAARLSASFPYVTPVSRADTGGRTGYHVADGGYWDNHGTVEAVEWLRAARHEIGAHPVLLIEIRSSPTRIPPAPEDRAWTFALTGPLRALYEVRLDAQRARNETELALLGEGWGDGSLTRVRFSLADDLAPLTWNLGAQDLRRIERAWTRDDNMASLARVRQFLVTP